MAVKFGPLNIVICWTNVLLKEYLQNIRPSLLCILLLSGWQCFKPQTYWENNLMGH